MKYIELLCKFNSNELSSDVIIAFLSEFPFESFLEEDNIVKAYIRNEDFNFESIEYILKDKGFNISLSYEIVEQTNWNTKWESDYKPVIIENECVVRTGFHEKQKNIKYDIIIEPKMSFGTGHHETTYLMLLSMLEMDFINKDILDMGCGTGVLAILTRKMGARSCLAIDNDQWTYENILENISLNNVNNIKVRIGDADQINDLNFDAILANINRNVLVEHIKYYSSSLNTNGLMLLSGFYKNDIDIIKKETERHNIELIGFKEKNNWVAVMFKKL